MRFSTLFSFLFSLGLAGFAFGASATTIGVSPSATETEVLVGESVEQTIVLVRSGNTEEMRFTIQISEGEDFIDLLGQEEVVIPMGATNAPFTFAVHGRDLPAGDKTGKIAFISDAPIGEQGGNLVQAAVGINVTAHIVDALTQDKTVDASVQCDVLSDIALSNMRLERKKLGTEYALAASWDMTNNGSLPISSILYEVSVFNGNALISSGREAVDGVLEAGQTKTLQATKTLPRLSPGTYRAEVKMGDQTISGQMVVEPTLWQSVLEQTSLILVALSGLLTALFAVLFYRARMSLVSTLRTLHAKRKKAAAERKARKVATKKPRKSAG